MCISSLDVLDIKFKTREADSLTKNMYGKKHRGENKGSLGRQFLAYQGNPDLPFHQTLQHVLSWAFPLLLLTGTKKPVEQAPISV